MKRQIIMGVLAVATLAGGAWNVRAEPGPCGDGTMVQGAWGKGEGGDPERHLARMGKALGLSDAQKEQIKAILKGERDNSAPLRERLAESHKRLREAARFATFDEAAVRSMATDQAQAMTELIVSRARVRSQIHAILTPEQREKADRLEPSQKRGKGRHPRFSDGR